MDGSSRSETPTNRKPARTRLGVSDFLVALGILSVTGGAATFHLGLGAIVLGLALILIGARSTGG
jgi:ABC-type uncharacterized transport system permease subunit